MIFRILTIAVIALALVYPDSGADKALAGLMLLFSILFYKLLFSCLTGLKIVDLDLDVDLNILWQNRVLLIAGAIALYQLNMIEIFYFVLPFQIISLLCDLLVTGYMLGILTMEVIEEDEEKED